MPRNTVTVSGIREMFRNARNIERTILSVAEAAARVEAEKLANEIRELAPVDSGDLRDSVYVDDVLAIEGQADESVIIGMYYTPWVEFGTEFIEPRRFIRDAVDNLGLSSIEGIARKVGLTIDLLGDG